jgi:hypothetical protein
MSDGGVKGISNIVPHWWDERRERDKDILIRCRY